MTANVINIGTTWGGERSSNLGGWGGAGAATVAFLFHSPLDLGGPSHHLARTRSEVYSGLAIFSVSLQFLLPHHPLNQPLHCSEFAC